MTISRRDFLKISGSLPLPFVLPRHLLAAGGSTVDRDVLVFLFLRGGLDSLNFLVPYGDGRYYELRPSLAVPQPSQEGGAIDLDGHFGLHPNLAPLADLYSDGELALVCAAGSPDDSHSHFESQDFAENGTPGDKSTESGWIGRYLDGVGGSGAFRAVGMGQILQKSLYGPVPAVSVSSVESFGLVTSQFPALRTAELAMEALYAGDNPLQADAGQAFAALGEFGDADPARYEPENGAEYPQSSLGQSLMEAGQILKAGLGVEVICLDAGGWDTHDNQTPTLDGLFDDLARSIAAFHADMGERMSNICLVGMSEFGRRAYENASGGTDHGHGGMMFLLGGGVNGGRVYGDWPTLNESALYGAGDLAVVNDFRTVLSEVAYTRLGVSDLGALFPGFEQTEFLGICV